MILGLVILHAAHTATPVPASLQQKIKPHTKSPLTNVMQASLETPILCAALRDTMKAAIVPAHYEIFSHLVADAFPGSDASQQVIPLPWFMTTTLRSCLNGDEASQLASFAITAQWQAVQPAQK